MCPTAWNSIYYDVTFINVTFLTSGLKSYIHSACELIPYICDLEPFPWFPRIKPFRQQGWLFQLLEQHLLLFSSPCSQSWDHCQLSTFDVNTPASLACFNAWWFEGTPKIRRKWRSLQLSWSLFGFIALFFCNLQPLKGNHKVHQLSVWQSRNQQPFRWMSLLLVFSLW